MKLSVALTALLSSAALASPGLRISSSPATALGFPGGPGLTYCSIPQVPMVEVLSVKVKTGNGRYVIVEGKAKKDIVNGTVSEIDLKLPFIGGPGQAFNFCQDTGVKCPIPAGSTFTATHNLTLKLWPGFSEDRYKLEFIMVSSLEWPFEFLTCIEGPWKSSSAAIVAQDDEVEWPLMESKEHWEMA